MKKKIAGSKKLYWVNILSFIIFLLISHSTAVGASLVQDQEPHIVFLVSEDPNNYEAHKTIPKFAESLSRNNNYKVSVLIGSGENNSYNFPNLQILSDADLVVVFFRRVALETKQLNLIKNYLKGGKPLIGIRTANHAFSVRNGEIPAGYEPWRDFVPEILGCENRGHGPAEFGTYVSIAPESNGHPILENIQPNEWFSAGNIYRVTPLVDEHATILLLGDTEEISEPVAWTRTAGRSRIFYTSLGYPDDFEVPQFLRLLINGIRWALNEKTEN